MYIIVFSPCSCYLFDSVYVTCDLVEIMELFLDFLKVGGFECKEWGKLPSS